MSTDTDRDRETDEWVTATHIADALRKTADTIASDAASRDNSTPQEPVDASEAPLEVPASERPASRVPGLPRPIKPEDVRVGMLVERRKGESAYRDRVQRISGDFIGSDPTRPYVWMPANANSGWSLWLVEDAPAPVDPDAADRQCAWADYRKDYGVGESDMVAAHKAFMAGWKAAREGDQSGPLR